MCRCLLFVLCLSSSYVFCSETVYWQTYHRPPATILHGEFKKQGFVDRSLQLVTQQLPQYRHVQYTSTLARAIQDMKQGKPVCHPALYQTKERESHLTFSIPSIITPTIQLVATPDFIEANELSPPVDLKPLIDGDRFSFALVAGRSYGEEIDAMLDSRSHQYSQLLMPVSGMDQVFSLVQKKRVDLTIAYPFEFNFYLKAEAPGSEPLRMLPFANTKQPFVLGSFACPKNPWGRKVIEQINRALERVRGTSEYLQAMTQWWPKQAETPEFIAFYRNSFLQTEQ